MLRPSHLSLTTIAIFSGLFFSSCDSYYFSRPQPIDRQDERSFPRAMRGQWMERSDNEEMGGDVILADTLQTHYYIDQHRIWTLNQEEVVLLDRLCTPEMAEQEKTGEGQPLPSIRETRLDSSTGQMDTIENFILPGNRIHPVEDELLRRGYAYQRHGDTIRFVRRDTSCMELGHHMVLRKASKNIYVLNFRDGVSREVKDWWEVLLVRPSSSGIDIYTSGKKMGQPPALMLERNKNHYLDLDIRAGELEGMIRDSLFVMSMRLVAR